MLQALIEKDSQSSLFLSNLVMSVAPNDLLILLSSMEPQMQVDWNMFLLAGVTGMPW